MSRPLRHDQTMRLTLALVLLATAAPAETPLSGAAFDSYTAGRTFSFSTGATPFGQEWYGPKRSVIWAFSDDDCVTGQWSAEDRPTGTAICFAYDDLPEPQCWHVFAAPDGLTATFLGSPDIDLTYSIRESTSGLICANLAS